MSPGDLLRLHLQTVVPLRVVELRGTTWEERIARCEEASRVLAEHGDELMFGGKRCREALRAVVDGVAHLSFCPGGVEVFGERFDAEGILAGFGLDPERGIERGDSEVGQEEQAPEPLP